MAALQNTELAGPISETDAPNQSESILNNLGQANKTSKHEHASAWFTITKIVQEVKHYWHGGTQKKTSEVVSKSVNCCAAEMESPNSVSETLPG